MKQLPIVSVCMITYNHEKFIEQAISSVLMQDCGFEIELVIVNDCSLDGTNEIIENFIKNNIEFSNIRYIKHAQNIGMMVNFIFALQQCKGQYIAICEGDDYWTDPLKLQKQVAFMKSKPGIAFTFHRAEILFKEKLSLNYKNRYFLNKQEVETKYFLDKAGARYCSASAMFTRNVVEIIPEWFRECHVADFPLMFLALEQGKIGYLEDVMCVYRMASHGSWSALNLKFSNRLKNLKRMVILNRMINKNTNGKYKIYLKTNLLSYVTYKFFIEVKAKLGII